MNQTLKALLAFLIIFASNNLNAVAQSGSIETIAFPKNSFKINESPDLLYQLISGDIIKYLIPQTLESDLEKEVYKRTTQYKKLVDSLNLVKKTIISKTAILQFSKINISKYNVSNKSFRIEIETNFLDSYGVILSRVRIKLDSAYRSNLSFEEANLISKQTPYGRAYYPEDCNPQYELILRVENLDAALKMETLSKHASIGILFFGSIKGSEVLDSRKIFLDEMFCQSFPSRYATVKFAIRQVLIYNADTNEIIYRSR